VVACSRGVVDIAAARSMNDTSRLDASAAAAAAVLEVVRVCVDAR